MVLDPCIGLTVLAAAAVGHPAAGPHTLSGGTASVSSSGKSLSALPSLVNVGATAGASADAGIDSCSIEW